MQETQDEIERSLLLQEKTKREKEEGQLGAVAAAISAAAIDGGIGATGSQPIGKFIPEQPQL